MSKNVTITASLLHHTLYHIFAFLSHQDRNIEFHYSSSAIGNIMVEMRNGMDLSVESLARSGFRQPIFIARKDGLNLRCPGSDFTVRDVALNVGKFLTM